MKKAAYLAVIALVILMVGCGGKKAVKPSAEVDASNKSIKALEEMRLAYVGRDAQGVLKFVSKEFKDGGYADIQRGLRKDTESFGKADLDIKVERAELAGEKSGVVFRWFCNWTDKSGNVHEGRGNAVFWFKETATGVELIETTGDSPFGALKS